MLAVRVSPASSASLAPGRSHLNPGTEHGKLGGICGSPSRRLSFPRRLVKPVQAGEKETAQVEARPLTGVVFEPFVEVQQKMVQVPQSCSESLARQRFAPACEAAINNQINLEYNVSYVYHALYAYFDRDNVGLPGFAKFFKEASEEERGHAEKLMKYQNVRGGKVVLHQIESSNLTDLDHGDKGDALYAMEYALALEKVTNERLLALHKVAEEYDDPQMQDFIESEFLQEQVESIKMFSVYVSQLRRIGKGHGVYHFDLKLLDGED